MFKKFRTGSLLCLMIIALVFALAACSGSGKGSSEKASTSAQDQTTGSDNQDGDGQSTAEADSEQEDASEELDDIVIEQMVDQALEHMTLEQKIGQLFVVCTDSLDFDAETKMTDKAAETLSAYQPGGVILFSFNLKDPDQTRTFIEGMQNNSHIPLFIAVDEEGGRVSRIANTEGMNTTKFPSMSEIGAVGNPDLAGKVGETIGREIHDLGFNLDLAPVADIATNNTNTEIGDRSFGSDPEVVADMVAAMVKALQKTGVSATLKHFPGQGDTGEDTHRGYVNLDTNIDRLRDVEFVPFEAGIKAGADMVMVSHVAVSNITQNEVPASLSSLMVSDILRGELQFDGVIITDAMNMKVITKFYDPAQAAMMAIDAGNDMVLMPDDFVEAYNGLLEAVKDGDLSEKKIDNAVERILAVKIRRGIIPADSELIKKE